MNEQEPTEHRPGPAAGERFFRSFLDRCPALIYVKDDRLRHVFGNVALLKRFGKTLEGFQGTRAGDFFPPEVAREIESADADLLSGTVDARAVEIDQTVDHKRLLVRDIKFPLEGPAGEVLIGGLAVDFTQRLSIEENLNEQVEFERLIADIAATLAATRPVDLEASVDEVLASLGRFLRTERAFLFRFSEDRRSLKCTNTWVAEDLDEPKEPLLAVTVDLPFLLRRIESGLPILVNPGMEGIPDEMRSMLESLRVNSGVVVPVAVEGTSVGLVGLDTVIQPREYPPVVVDRLRIVADMIGSTLERVRIETALLESVSLLVRAQEEERRRIARELHDDTSQQLISLSMDLAALGAKVRAGKDLADDLDALAKRGRSVAAQVHGMSRRLHPAVVEDLGLRRALEAEIEAFESRSGLRVETDLDFGAKDELPLHVATSLFRIAQEGLRNVRKHARVTSARATLVRQGTEVVVRIEDAGVGFEVEVKVEGEEQTGIGLRGMEERARLAGGALVVESTPGRGTTITARVPLMGTPS